MRKVLKSEDSSYYLEKKHSLSQQATNFYLPVSNLHIEPNVALILEKHVIFKDIYDLSVLPLESFEASIV